MFKGVGTGSFIAITIAVTAMPVAAVEMAPKPESAYVRSDVIAVVKPDPQIAATGSSSQPVTDPAQHLHEVVWPNALQRLAYLATLADDHNGEGARAPIVGSVETARRFLGHLPFFTPRPKVGLNDDGGVVVEFHDEADIGQVTFADADRVEVYHSGQLGTGVFFEGPLADAEVQDRFLSAFGFPLVV